MRGNRSAAVTATGGGWKMEKCKKEEGWRKVKVLMPKKETCARQMLDYALEMVHG